MSVATISAPLPQGELSSDSFRPRSASINPFVAIAAVDVGSPLPQPKKPHGSIGWAVRLAGKRISSGDVRDLDKCVRLIGDALSKGAVALGFECPCFLPISEDANLVTKARCGEGNRAWSAPSGLRVTAQGPAVAGHVLLKLRGVFPSARPTFEFDRQADEWGSGDLLLFEAFVTGDAKGKTGMDKEDACIAVKAFEGIARSWPPKESAVNARGMATVNLLAAALIATGWDVDKSMVSQTCLVVRP